MIHARNGSYAGVLTASAVAARSPILRSFAADASSPPGWDSRGDSIRFDWRQGTSRPLTRRGDTYLRGLFVQGARSALQAAMRASPPRRTRLAAWIVATYERIGYHKTLVAIANKHGRLIWVLLTRDEPLRAHAAMN